MAKDKQHEELLVEEQKKQDKADSGPIKPPVGDDPNAQAVKDQKAQRKEAEKDNKLPYDDGERKSAQQMLKDEVTPAEGGSSLDINTEAKVIVDAVIASTREAGRDFWVAKCILAQASKTLGSEWVKTRLEE